MVKFLDTRISEEEISEIRRVANSGWLGNGSEVKLFEKELGEKLNNPNTLFINACTSGLFMSMNLLGIGEGDEVIVPSIHFLVIPNVILSVKAKPVFVDVSSSTLNIMPDSFLKAITRKTKAVILLHYGGHPCNLKAILDIAKQWRVSVITDNANSPASTYKGLNCSAYGDISCLSFDSMKIMTTIDGGAICTNTKELYDKAMSLRYYGVALKNQSGLSSCKEGNNEWWKIEMDYTSERYTSNDVLAAIGRVQLKKLGSMIERRKQIWNIYQQEFKNLSWLELPPESSIDTTSSYYFYWLKTHDRNNFARYLVDKEIYCNFKYYPLHLIKKFNSDLSLVLPGAEYALKTTINIPIHSYLTDSEVDYVIDTIKKYEPKKNDESMYSINIELGNLKTTIK